MRLLAFLFLLTVSILPTNAAEPGDKANTSAPAPQWYLDDVDFLTRDGGRWVASNADYQGENEPMEAYVIEWEKGYANSMTGRLYGIVDGEPTGDFWRFRQYWHPGKGKAILEQFGLGGAVGVGTLWQDGDVNKTLQTFYAPDGSASDQGHEAHNPDGDTHVTASFDVADGVWKERRSYSWKRDKTAIEEKS